MKTAFHSLPRLLANPDFTNPTFQQANHLRADRFQQHLTGLAPAGAYQMRRGRS